MARLFEFDPEKAKGNAHKHSVTFLEAQTVFSDPCGLDAFDVAHSESEERFLRLGMSLDGRLITVVYVERELEGNTVTRLISARRADAREVLEYLKRRGIK
ncbi:hypothetical protein PHYC_00389 [Phycisphaerales bacterium]|nr:hypothetical protein PHYC_00389 [Phycisphaerales bacterium]